MIRSDEQGNLYTLTGNNGYFTIKDLPKIEGKLHVVFDGDDIVEKEYDLNNQTDVIVKLSKEDIESIGEGKHTWYADLINSNGEDVDTIIYQCITIMEK